MTIVAHDPFATEASARAAGARLVELDELLRTADVVSVHVPLTEKTRGLMGEASLAKMKKSAIVVNTSRGEVVDLPALADALAGGRLSGAGLEPSVAARQLGPLGKRLSARADMLEERGLLQAGVREEEILVVEARRPH